LRLLLSAPRGSGAVVLIGAEAGMGKSRLVAELAALATRAGATTVIGECCRWPTASCLCTDRERAAVSLAARGEQELTGLIGVANDELVRLLAELGDHAGPGRSVAADGVGSPAGCLSSCWRCSRRAAREAPVRLVVEDVHWSDRSTRDFLTFLVRGIRHERLVLVLTYRQDEVQRNHQARPFCLELERSGQAVRLELRGFGPT